MCKSALSQLPNLRNGVLDGMEYRMMHNYHVLAYSGFPCRSARSRRMAILLAEGNVVCDSGLEVLVDRTLGGRAVWFVEAPYYCCTL